MSDDPFLLSQLDADFDRAYARLTNAFRGFVQGWFRAPQGLAHGKDDCALVGHERGVVCEDGVGEPVFGEGSVEFVEVAA